MIHRTLDFVTEAVQGRLLRGPRSLQVRRVCTDSRIVQCGDLFIPLVGDRFDAHQFLDEVVGRGAAAVMLEDERKPLPPGECGVIGVANTRTALAQLAARHRLDFDIPLVAVAGSNGKTTTKEILARVLGTRWRTVASEASFNNDIGVPLTLLRVDHTCQAAVVEVGTNHPGELNNLLEIVRPRFGVITSIGPEHLEHFGTLAGVAEEEGSLAAALPEDGVLFVNGDSPEMERIVARSRARVVRVGMGPGNDWRAQEVRVELQGTTFRVVSADPRFHGDYELQLLGRHQVTNALLAAAVGAQLGLTPTEVRQGLRECSPAKMRLQAWSAGGVVVLDDCYNANEDSMNAALSTLCALESQGRRIAVLGDMAELGRHAEAAHMGVGRQAAAANLDHLFAVGRYGCLMAEAARKAGLAHVTAIAEVEDAAEAVSTFLRCKDLVLLKASRSTRLERIGQAIKDAVLARGALL